MTFSREISPSVHYVHAKNSNNHLHVSFYSPHVLLNLLQIPPLTYTIYGCELTYQPTHLWEIRVKQSTLGIWLQWWHANYTQNSIRGEEWTYCRPLELRCCSSFSCTKCHLFNRQVYLRASELLMSIIFIWLQLKRCSFKKLINKARGKRFKSPKVQLFPQGRWWVNGTSGQPNWWMWVQSQYLKDAWTGTWNKKGWEGYGPGTGKWNLLSWTTWPWWMTYGPVILIA